MYEHFFSLRRRPFAATPDPACWYHSGPFRAALDELLICVERGEGINVLVAPPGTGKTLLCERLIRDLGQEFVPAFLRHVTFATRRSFLQALLAELNEPFDKQTDQELRLNVVTWLKDLHHLGRKLALVVDEAHLLAEAVLDELRILADYAQDGQSVVRLVLSGQLSLEEKLALPGVQPLNQRIRSYVILPLLTAAESADYVDFRVTWAGGRTAELFTSEALTLICRAADGIPRCLNQLCDHALLSAYATEERPVSVATVRQALDDLSHLSLTWNAVSLPPETSTGGHSNEEVLEIAPPAATAAPGEVRTWAASHQQITGSPADENAPTEHFSTVGGARYSLVGETGNTLDTAHGTTDEPAAPASAAVSATGHDDDQTPVPVYRLSRRWDASESSSFGPPVFAEATPPSRELPLETGPWASSSDDQEDREDTSEVQEEPVLDRYAALDAGLEPPPVPSVSPTRTVEPPRDLPPSADWPSENWPSEVGDTELPPDIRRRLAAVKHVLDAVAEADEQQDRRWTGTEAHPPGFSSTTQSGSATLEDVLQTQVLDTCAEVKHFLGEAETPARTPTPTTPRTEAPCSSSESATPAVNCLEVGADLAAEDRATSSPPPPTRAEARPATSTERRSYRNLFTLLRRKQQGHD
uniref:AAA family ATPase n=1 Tax=Schlesneria paludicola TaxID=360056 RepID=A0A7C4LQX9_9PLAN